MIRQTFRAVIDVVIDFEPASVHDVKRALLDIPISWDSQTIVRSLEPGDAPEDAKPLNDYDVKCYSCNEPSARSTSKPWCPSPEVETLYTCKSCRDSCGGKDCVLKTCMIHSVDARNAKFYRDRNKGL